MGHSRATTLAALAVAASLVSQNLGAAFAKSLFPRVGPEGMAGLRVGFAALLLLVWFRPWRHPLPARAIVPLIAYGTALGAMNFLVYRAFGRLPIGIAIAIEITGPLLVVLLSSRRLVDLAWLASASLGLALLLPLGRGSHSLDREGVVYAVGAASCWALYIVFGKRVAHLSRGQAVAWGMLVAAVVTVPPACAHSGTSMLTPAGLGIGLVVALLSSAVPYSLEMFSLATLPRPVFGLLVSAAPAVGAVAGALVLGEHLGVLQWLAITCLVVASAGSAVMSVRDGKRAQSPTPAVLD